MAAGADARAGILAPVASKALIGALLLIGSTNLERTRASDTTVAIDLTGLSAGTFARLDGLTLERRVLVRLVQEGFAVVDRERGPACVARVWERSPALMLTVGCGSGALEEELKVGREGLPVVHLQVAQKTVGMVRTLTARRAPAEPARRAEEAPPVAVPPPPPPAAMRLDPPPRTEPPATSAAEWRLLVGAAGQFRSPAPDPCVRLALSRGGRSGAAVHLSLAAAASRGASIRVGEVQAGAGLGWRWTLHPRLSVEAGATLALLAHGFIVDDPSLTKRRGVRWDVIVDVPVAATLWLGDRLGVAALGSVTVADRDRAHLNGDRRLWYRRAVWATVGAALEGRW